MARPSNLLWIAALLAVPAPFAAQAQPAGTAALLEQARYWEGRNRKDLANQAYRRVLAIDPANAAARRGLAGGPKAAAPAPAKPAAAPKVSAFVPAPRAPAKAPARAPAPQAPAADRAGEDRAAGFRLLDGGDLSGAAKRFQSAIARNGNDSDALGGLGIVRLRTDRFAEARDLLAKASRGGSASKWAEALASARFYAGMNDAQAALDAGRTDEAAQMAESLANSDFKQREPALELLGSVYERQGRYGDAAALYAKLGTGAKGQSATLQSRALRLQALDAAATGNAMQAEQYFQSGLMANPKDPWIRYEFARFLAGNGRRADADSLIGSLSSSADPESLYAAALLNSEANRSAAAEAVIERIPVQQRTAQMRSLSLGLKVDSAIARGKALGAQGQGPQALAALRQIAAMPGIAGDKQGAIAEALYDLGDPTGAATLARQALTTGSATAAGYEPIVRVLAKTGQDAFAMSAIQKASELAGPSPEGQRSIARLSGAVAASRADQMREAGQFAPAFDLLQSSWNAAPGNSEVLAALARLYQSGNLHPQAVQTYLMLLNQNPADKGALLGLIDSAAGAGDFDLARQSVARAIRAAPNDHEVYLAAARMEKARGNEGASIKYLKQARALYMRQNAPGGGFSSGNPFSAMPQGNNPFAAAAAPLNPFALGSAAPAPYAQSAYAMPQGFAPAPQAYPQALPFMAAPMADMGTASYGMPQSFGSAAGPVITDPVLQSIDQDMRALTADSGPRADVGTGYRQRSGETGLSALRELTGSAELSTDFADGRVSARAEAVVLDSGRPLDSGLARFGRNGTAEAQGIVDKLPSLLSNAQTQHAAGVALSAKYEGKIVTADIGSTPLGFAKTDIAGGVALTPRFSPNSSGRIWAERRPVTDSVVSYAGTEDPVTGDFWGAVMKSGGGASLSFDKDGTGFYADGSYYDFKGHHVRGNSSIQANVGAYLRAMQTRTSKLTLGINANYQSYANNQNYFTYGHGGYFSPQSFLSVSFPVRYTLQRRELEIAVNVAPGYQSYEQDEAPLYPNDPAEQANLDALKALNTDVRSNYDSVSQTGFGISAGGSAYYRLGGRTRIGGEVNINTFGNYNELRTFLGIKQSLGSQD